MSQKCLLNCTPDEGGHSHVADGLSQVEGRVPVGVLEVRVGAGLEEDRDDLGASGEGGRVQGGLSVQENYTLGNTF